MSSANKPGIQIAWKTVTYRSVMLMILAGLAVMGIATRRGISDFTTTTVKAADLVFANLLEQIAAPRGLGKIQRSDLAAGAHHGARRHGRIKKASSNSWVQRGL